MSLARFTWLLGLDFGVVDQNALSVVGWRPKDPCVYVAQSYRLTAIPSEMGREIQRLEEQYRFAQIVGDVGGLGKAYVAEIAARFTIPIEPAEKNNKAGYIRLFNGDLRRGRIKVVRSACEQLLEEWRDLPWHESKAREADGFPNHCSDATLYAWRAACAYCEREPGDAETPQARVKREEAAMESAAEDEADRQAGQEWWET